MSGHNLVPAQQTASWSAEQFWQYVSGLAGDHEAGQMRDMLASQGLQLVSSLPQAMAPNTLCGMISEVYGSLDAEDCKMVDREWAKMRGYILPSDGTSMLILTAGTPVAFVPVHPRNGPLWSDTFRAGSEVQRSENYKRMALYAEPHSPAASAAKAPSSCPQCHDANDCSNVDICNAVAEVCSSPAPIEPTREALEASSTCPICGKDTPHSHYDEDAELELICRPTFEFHLRHWLHMYFPEKRMRRGEMLGVQGWSSRDSYNPQRIIPRRAPADYIDPVIEGLWGQWLAAWLSKPSWCNAFDKIAMAKQIERQSPLAESAALAHPTPTAQQASGQYDFPYQRTFDAIAAATEIYPSKEQALGFSISVRKFQEAFNNHRDARPLSTAPAAQQNEPVAHVLNEWADLGSNALQWLRNIKDGFSTADEALAEMRSNYDRVLTMSRAAPPAPSSPPGMREALEKIEKIISDHERILCLPDAKTIKQIWEITRCALSTPPSPEPAASPLGEGRSQAECESVSDLGVWLHDYDYGADHEPNQNCINEYESMARAILAKYDVRRRA